MATAAALVVKSISFGDSSGSDAVASFLPLGEHIASGSSGTIYEWRDDPTRVVKSQSLKGFSFDVVPIMHRLGEVGVSPRLHGMFVEGDTAYTIMDRLGHTLNHALERSEFEEYRSAVKDLLQRVIDEGIFLPDVNADNFMFDDGGRLYLIDLDDAMWAASIGKVKRARMTRDTPDISITTNLGTFEIKVDWTRFESLAWPGDSSPVEKAREDRIKAIKEKLKQQMLEKRLARIGALS